MLSSNLRPFVRRAAIALASFSTTFPSLVFAAEVPGGSIVTIDASTPVQDWNLLMDSTLNANGATTTAISGNNATLNFSGGASGRINLLSQSAANITNVSINNNSLEQTFSLSNSQGTLTNTDINNAGGVALGLLRTGSAGSAATMNAGSLTGLSGAALVSAYSTLTLNSTKVTGTAANSYGIRAVGGSIVATDSTITAGTNGVQMFGDMANLQGSVILNGTQVQGLTGAAITVNGLGLGIGLHANVQILNGSTLIGGNGNALEVVDATASVTLENSSVNGNLAVTDNGSGNVTLGHAALNGNISADETSTASLTMNNGSAFNGNTVNVANISLDQSAMAGNVTGSNSVALLNQSTFTGNLVDVQSVTVGNQSTWNMVADNTVGSLNMSGGSIKFGAANEFYQLNASSLSGNGTFVMDVDYQTNQHDTLNITGNATGTHELLIAGSGTDPLMASPITVVKTASGDAVFGLTNGPVDVGTYSYGLASTVNASGGTDWYLDPASKIISPGTRSVLALFNTAPTVWYGELSSLRSRMGELRFNGSKAGGWMRTYGNKYNVADASGTGYQQTQQGISLGADAPLPVGDGQWLIGVLAGYSKSDLDLDRGTSGTVKSTYLGAYTTWMDQDSGYYFDGVLKLNRFRNDSKVSMSDGTRSKGNYDTSGLGGSLEFGRHIKLDNGYFLEPFTQLSAVVIGGKDYELDNGMEAEGDRTRSLLGKLGVTGGQNFTLSNGSVVQPYVRVAGVHEFAKNNEVQVNNNVFNNDLSGSRAEFGAGVAVAFSESLQLHADFDYSKGENIEQPFGANVGVRYSW